MPNRNFQIKAIKRGAQSQKIGKNIHYADYNLTFSPSNLVDVGGNYKQSIC